MSGYKYLFGPVPSRRLGASLGVSPIPERTCNYSCVYCQLGRTLRMTNTRQEFFPLEEILAEFREYLRGSIPFDVVTVVGEGEPTLYSRSGRAHRRAQEGNRQAGGGDHQRRSAL